MLKPTIIFLIKKYHTLFSWVLPISCRFHPSCSIYTIQAIGRFGLMPGLWRGFLRILRCGPWSRGGYNPIVADLEETQTPK